MWSYPLPRFRFSFVFSRCTRNQVSRFLSRHLSSNSGWGSEEGGGSKCSVNYMPLSPISFLERSGSVHRDQISIIEGSVKYTWRETHLRCLRLASALTQIGISRGDVVATLAPNILAMYELHFGVPMAGAVLCTLNIRQDPAMISVLLSHSEAKVIFVDYHFLDTARRALDLLSQKNINPPLLVLIPESNSSDTSHNLQYESLLGTGKTDFKIRWPEDECDPISINYTSGTTSRPKGVVYSHRGAYLNSIATVLLHEMRSLPVYLWTVPMFHCNGWCLIWGVAAQGGTNICIRKVLASTIFESIAVHKVTHMGGAPTVLNMLANAPDRSIRKKPFSSTVVVLIAGSPPPPQLMLDMEELGFHIIHAYGLTETYGPATFCSWKPEWDGLPAEQRAKIKSRQGLHHVMMGEVDIRHSVTMASVPSDGKTMGEAMFRGNTVMSRYWKDLKATKEAFSGGWFRSGDLGVKHNDGYIEIKDRCKDIIISGGENVSSVEVESVLFSHPAVLEVGVVGRPDEHWGETVCAFVKVKEGFEAKEEEIIEFCRGRLPHYMAPRSVVFIEELPKTSTGKIQKFVLRDKAKAMGSLTNKSRG